MAVTWFKTNFLGVRYREHKSRKNGIKPDRCFSVRYKLNGKDKEEVVGWGSEGVTAERAFTVLSTIRENIRTGTGPCSMAEIRQTNQHRKEEEIKARRRKEKESITFSDFWDAEYLPAAELIKKPTTMESEKGLYSKWISPVLGNMPLQQLDVSKVESLMFHVQRAGRSAASIRYVLAIVSQVWNKAVSKGIVQGESPTRRLKKPRQDNRRMRFLTHDEARALLKALRPRSVDMHDSALLSLFCGLRAGEIHALTWGDVDLHNDLLFIRDPKNKNNRSAYITDEVRDMLERRFDGQPTTDLLFPSTNGKRRRWVSDTFARVVDELGFNDTGEVVLNKSGDAMRIRIKDSRQRVVFHSLRHTFASWLVQAGTDLYKVKELMGHEDIKMTMRYAHLAPKGLREDAMKLQGSLSE